MFVERHHRFLDESAPDTDDANRLLDGIVKQSGTRERVGRIELERGLTSNDRRELLLLVSRFGVDDGTWSYLIRHGTPHLRALSLQVCVCVLCVCL
jgi:hypothetical protein